MADCDWMILCNYAFRDEGKRTCLIGTFDRIFVKNVPTMRSSMALAFKLIGDPDERVLFKMQLIRPTGGELAQMGGETRLSDLGTNEINLNFAGVQLPDFGIYAFNLLINDQLVRAATFTVSKAPDKPRP
jgi:hypothetical protein